MNENDSLKNTNIFLSSEYENSKKHLLEYESSIKKLFTEFERLQGIMQEIKKQNNQLKSEYKSK